MSDETLYCSFCAKSQHEVRKLIAAPAAFICDECVGLCAAICISDPKTPGLGIWHVSRTAPVDSKSIIKEIVKELREEFAAAGIEAPTGGESPVGNAEPPTP